MCMCACTAMWFYSRCVIPTVVESHLKSIHGAAVDMRLDQVRSCKAREPNGAAQEFQQTPTAMPRCTNAHQHLFMAHELQCVFQSLQSPVIELSSLIFQKCPKTVVICFLKPKPTLQKHQIHFARTRPDTSRLTLPWSNASTTPCVNYQARDATSVVELAIWKAIHWLHSISRKFAT